MKRLFFAAPLFTFFYFVIDRALTIWLSKFYFPPIISFFSALITPFYHLIFWSLVFMATLTIPKLRQYSKTLVDFPLSVGLHMFVIGLLKMLFARARPELLLADGTYGFHFAKLDTAYLSFPSSHAATSFGIAYLLGVYFPRYQLPLFLVSAALSLTRVVLHRHYLSDVLIGAMIGISITKFVTTHLGDKYVVFKQ